MLHPVLIQAKDTWDGLDKWVKRFAVLGTSVTLFSTLSGPILQLTLDSRYALAADAGKFVTKAELVAEARQMNQQIRQIQKSQLENERRRLRDELYTLKELSRPADRRQILKLEDDIKDIDRELRRLDRGQ